jgi:NADH:ubiquinone oxidoreductase subunit 4 (subunit M)
VWPTIVALFAIVLASAYMLRLFQSIMNGPEVPDLPERRDMTWLEGFAVAPLIVAFVLLGVHPGPLLTSLGTARAEAMHVISTR